MAKEIRIPLEEVHCAHCEARITEALTQLPGVLRVQASQAADEVLVTLAGGPTTAETIKKRLTELGYEPQA